MKKRGKWIVGILIFLIVIITIMIGERRLFRYGS